MLQTCIFLIICRKITPKSLKSFVKRNLFQLFLLYLHHEYYEYGSKEVESVKGRYGREGSVKYMVVGKLGVSQATVSKWMTNFSQPNIETLIKISKVLNVEVSELLRTDEVQIDA